MKIKRRDSADILSALAGGVVPKKRSPVYNGGPGSGNETNKRRVKRHKRKWKLYDQVFVGAYGTGKSFMQNFVRQVGLEEGFVVTNADFTPHRRLYGSDNQALALYNELIKNLSTKSAPQGNTLPIILDQWIMGLQKKVMEDLDYEDRAVLEESVFVQAVEKEIVKAVSHLDELTGGYDFAKVLSIYYKSFVKQDKENSVKL